MYVYHIFFIQSSVVGCLGCFHIKLELSTSERKLQTEPWGTCAYKIGDCTSVSIGRGFLEILAAFGFHGTEVVLDFSVMKAKAVLELCYSASVAVCCLLPSSFRIGAQQADTSYFAFVQKDITAVTKEGKFLLTNLEVPDAEGAVSSRLENDQPTSGDWQTINK